MHLLATIALEVPCRRPLHPHSCALVLCNGTPFQVAPMAPGHLRHPPKLAKAVNQIISRFQDSSRTQVNALARTNPDRARTLRQKHELWVARVKKQHLTAHQLRADSSECFRAFAIPDCVRRQLLRQQAPDAWPQDPLVQVCFVLPVTPKLRLLDKVCAYQRAPQYCPRTKRLRKCNSGHWIPLDPARTQAQLLGHNLVVLVW